VRVKAKAVVWIEEHLEGGVSQLSQVQGPARATLKQ
jgi:hypothetical protein